MSPCSSRLFSLFITALVSGGSLIFSQEPSRLPTKEEIIAADAPVDTLTASQLSAGGQQAFVAGNFARAAECWAKFLADYASSPEAAARAAEIKPLLALCHVRLGKFEEARSLIETALTAAPVQGAALLAAPLREELAFCRGICALKQGETAAAQKAFGEFWKETKYAPARRDEALLLFGTGYVMLEQWADAAEFFAKNRRKLTPGNVDAHSRAAVMQLHALLQGGWLEDALALLREMYPSLDKMTQLAGFQSLAVELGDKFLAEESWTEAIQCLQRIWPADRIVKHQQERLEQLKQQRQAVALRRGGADVLFSLDQTITRVEREAAQFAKVESFDAAVRLRLVQAYQGLQRWREAALVLQDMVQRLPADAVTESAAVALVQAWSELRRWPAVIEAADGYLEKFGQEGTEPGLPLVRFLKAEALRQQQKTAEAQSVFASIAKAWPSHELAPRAEFLAAICGLEEGRNAEAVEALAAYRKSHAKHPLAESAYFWEGQALAFDQKYQASRDHLGHFLKDHPQSGDAAAAEFRRAACAHALADYPTAIKELKAFLEQHPDSREVDEARILLGDALGAEGEIDQALSTWRAIPSGSGRWWEDAQFKIGKALKITGEAEALRKHYEQVIAAQPQSPRVAEALLEISRSWLAANQPDKAREAMWKAIDEFGNNPKSLGVEDALLQLKRAYAGADDQLKAELDKRVAQAGEKRLATLEARLFWARAMLASASPSRKQASLLELALKLDPAQHSARLLADAADTARADGNPRLATTLYEGLLKWNPRAIEKDRAYFGLGLIARESGKSDEALTWLDKAEKASLSVTLGGQIGLAQGKLYAATKKQDEAKRCFQRVMGRRETPANERAEAVLELGRLSRDTGDLDGAAAYFERVYAAYSRFDPLVAAAYFERGQVLEAKQEKGKASEVYSELLRKPKLASLPESAKARERLKVLGLNKEGEK